MSHPQYTETEAKQRGQEIYEQKLQSRFGQEHQGQTLVIDPETGEYEVGNLVEAIAHLQVKNPGVHLYSLHIGFPNTGRLVRRLHGSCHLNYKRSGEFPTEAMVEEAWRRGRERYEQIRRQVEPGNEHKQVVINTQTGEYTLTDDWASVVKSVDLSSVIAYTHYIGILGTVSFGYRGYLLMLANQKREKASGE